MHGLLHLLEFDRETSEKAEGEMKKEEEHLLNSLGWKGNGLIQSTYDAETHANSNEEKPDGNLTFYQFQFHIFLLWSFIYFVNYTNYK